MTTYPINLPKCVSCDEFALDGHLTCGRAECDESGNRDRLKAKGDMIEQKDYPTAEDWNQACTRFFDKHADCELDPNIITDDTETDA